MNDWFFDGVIGVIFVALMVGLVLIARSNRTRLSQWQGDQRILCAECGHGFWLSEAHQTEGGALCCRTKCCLKREVGEAIEQPPI